MEILNGGKILIIQTAFIGDSILTLPMIQKFKELYPETLIDIVCAPASRDIFAASPYINKVLVLDKRNEHKSIAQVIAFALKLKKEDYARIYSPHRSFRTALIVRITGVKDTYGFSNASMKAVYKHIVPYNKEAHEVRRNLEMLGADVSGDNWKILPIVNMPPEANEKIMAFLSELNAENTIAVAPGSVWATKKYPEEYFKTAIKHFVNNSYSVILVGGKEDKEYCERIAKETGLGVYSAAGKFSIIESIGLLKNCKLLISNDSAPTHFGMCADIPVLTLYCSTIAGFGFYPYSSKSSYLSYNDLECKPCGIHGHDKCPIGTFACGYELKPETVIIEAYNLLEKHARTSNG